MDRHRVVAVAASLLGLAALTAGTVVLALPTENEPAPPPSAAVRARGPGGAAVLPERLEIGRRLPPRAFDEAGRPATTTLALLVRVAFFDDVRLLGVDAATGGTVRIDDLPGFTGVVGSAGVAISPDGHLLTDGSRVLDLRTARVRRPAGLPAVLTPPAGSPARTVAVYDDGTVAVIAVDRRALWVSPPPGSGRTPAEVEGMAGLDSIEAQPDRRLLTHRPSADPMGLGYEVLDLKGPVPTRFPVLGLRPGGPVAESASTVVYPVRGGFELRDILGGTIRRLPVPLPTGSAALYFGAFDGAETPLVVLGRDGDGDVTIRQVSRYDRADAQAHTLTRLVTGPPATTALTRVTPAVQVLGRSVILVDAPREPWWTVLVVPLARTAAVAGIAVGLVLCLLALCLLATGLVVRRRRHTRQGQPVGGPEYRDGSVIG